MDQAKANLQLIQSNERKQRPNLYYHASPKNICFWDIGVVNKEPW